MKNIFPILSQYSQKKEDARGSLEMLYETSNLVLKRSFSKMGVFRGMLLQRPPHEQTKLIRVIRGWIIDFLVEPNSSGYEIHCRKIDATSDWIKIKEPMLSEKDTNASQLRVVSAAAVS